jgi:hypothetical protein
MIDHAKMPSLRDKQKAQAEAEEAKRNETGESVGERNESGEAPTAGEVEVEVKAGTGKVEKLSRKRKSK